MMSDSMFQQLEICQRQRDAALARERVLQEELAAVKKNGQFWYKSSGQAIDAMTLVANQRDALQLRLNAADQRIDDAAQYMRRTVDLVMQGCGNSYANAWCEKLLVIAKSFGAYNGATIGNIIDLREALQSANDLAIIGIERMPPMEYDEP